MASIIFNEPRWQPVDPIKVPNNDNDLHNHIHSGSCETPYQGDLGTGSIWRCDCGKYYQLGKRDSTSYASWNKISRRKAARYIKRRTRTLR